MKITKVWGYRLNIKMKIKLIIYSSQLLVINFTNFFARIKSHNLSLRINSSNKLRKKKINSNL
jgi:hypothetical protein